MGDRLIRAVERILPSRIEQVLRQIRVDKWTGSVILNIREGRVLGFNKHEAVNLASHEIDY